MKPKYLWFINALLAIIAAYIAYRIWFAPRNDAWSYIPDNAFMIVESAEIQQSIFDDKNLDANQLSDVPFFYDAIEQLRHITQLVDNQELSQKFLSKKLISYSLHRETKKNLEYVIYIPANNFGDGNFINQLLKPDVEKRKIYARTYKGVKLQELFELSGKSVLNFFTHDDYLICSSSKILLEDVVNRIKSGVAIERVPFKESRKGSAHIYFKSKNLQNVADILPSQLSPNLIEFFGNITPRNPDIVFEKAKELNTITAFIHSSGSSRVPFLGIFGKQVPKPIECADYISDKTAIMIRMSFHNNARFAQDMNAYLKANNETLAADKDSVNRFLNANLNSIYGVIHNEVVLTEMETQSDEPAKKILLIKTEDTAEAINLFDDFANKSEAFSAYNKPKPIPFLNYYIRKLEISQLPSMLFGSTFTGFSDCYYTLKDNYIILASDEEAMKNYLSDLNIGSTWSKSAIYTDFLKKLRPQAQVTAIVSPQRVWSNLYNSLPQKWKNSIAKHESRAKGLRFIALENFVKDASFGTKIIIEKQPKGSRKFSNKLFLQDSLMVNTPFTGVPLLIKNPANRADEIIIQQADNQLVLLNNQAQKINEVAASSQLSSNYFLATDYLQDGLLHYLSSIPQGLVVLSRDVQNGLMITEPPLVLSDGISAFAANDFKIYVSDNAGMIYTVDEETKKVGRVKTPAGLQDIVRIQPVKYKNGNYLAVLQRDGSLNILYENGANKQGFPRVPISAKPVEMIVEANSEKNSLITLVSELGEIKKVDMNGEVIETIQIEKTEKTTTFEVLFDQNRNDWIIIRRTPTNLFVFDKRGNSLMEIQNTNFLKSQLKYFDLGNDIRIIAVFDGKNNTFFDVKGNTIGDKPLTATSLPAISYSETYNKLFIYNPNNTRFEVWTVKVN